MKKAWLFIKRLLIIVGFFFLLTAFQLIASIFIRDELIITFFSYFFGFILAAVFFRKKLNFKKITNFGKYFGIFVLCYILTSFVTNLIYSFSNINSTNEVIVESLIIKKPLISFFITGLFAPFYEEVLFRLNFRDVFNKKWTFIIVTGILFGSTHLLNASSINEIIFLIPYSIMGISLSYIYYDSDNIYTSIVIHSINNIFILLLLLIGR